MADFDTRVKFIKGVGETREKALAKQGIYTVGDLLRNYPRAYEDWNKFTSISDAPIGETVCIRAIVSQNPHVLRLKGNKIIVKTFISDGMDYIPVVFFNNKYVKDKLIEDKEYLFFGKITIDKYGAKTMSSPRFEESMEKQRIRPVYRASAAIPSKFMERIVENALNQVKGNIKEFIPDYIVKKYRLMGFEESLRQVHFPDSEESLALAKRRLIFEELFLLQLGLLMEKSTALSHSAPSVSLDYTEKFYMSLPFEPTSAQRRAVDEAISDMRSNKPMNRLLQGDVGSGKTLVAAAIMYNAVKNGYQGAYGTHRGTCKSAL